MRLTRRDALRALTVASGIGIAGCSAPERDTTPDQDHVRGTMVAVAQVVYPSAVENVPEFVETWLDGRFTDGKRGDGIVAAVTEIDDRARDWYDDEYRSLDQDTRDSVLREMGVDTAEADPTGTIAERVRYYVVNELVYGLYTSPAGGRLAGIENPIGYPGGIESYQRGSEP